MDYPLYTYPNFKNIGIEDKDTFLGFTAKYPSYSDFNMLSLLSWDFHDVNSFSILNGNLILKMKEYLGENYLLSILGDNEIDSTLNILLESTDKLSFVPDTVVSKIVNKGQFKVIEDRDNFDYIVNVEKVTTHFGAEFEHLRYDLNKFIKNYPSYEVKTFNTSNQDIINESKLLTSKWVSDKNFDSAKNREQLGILDNFFKYSADFDTVLLGLFVDSKLVAYMFHEILDKDTVMSDFSASDSGYLSSAYMMEYVTAKYFFEKGYKLQNIQQDTGLSGLRSAKMFYKPEFLKKWVISKA
ncbi:hypothetical protein A3K01_01615 [candidate division WWE3 bacterium RIFOXYD1_FULL_43_17]|uniref:Phosphatidylglycerol lysyltransferase C-terminal domain-containing protein n=3 Tax=Katanobacteria TaxID=422282 RepID=A0A1F4XFS2_UNCKA|nr:MAG: hypothetical protein UU59_C0012G0011 [candidate division WWE3 bacterium GW2011_GWE1_41_27]KKS59257.1 MAG: hypothetical protein UV26_C0026G0012 [candidate division WWE3 bacterium GW2011_GWF2_42_42]OGC80515.1 MAG: hypothetical protein A3K01_01615 [candidate division WWE3 bacterium RIFOXYD1_FULL_43_17]